jgi:hypothetical protein
VERQAFLLTARPLPPPANPLKASTVESAADAALGDFQSEQRKFVNSKSKGGSTTSPPWVGHPHEGELREKILALSTDERNFVRDPPAGQKSIGMNLEDSFPVALAILAEDSDLKEMRFKLVPKTCTEDQFWTNYLYRVSLIVQSAEMVRGVAGDVVVVPVPVPVTEPEAIAPPMAVGVDPAEVDGDLSDHEFREDFYDVGGVSSGTESAVDLAALGSTVSSPIPSEPSDSEIDPPIDPPPTEVPAETPPLPPTETGAPSPADPSTSPDDDWEKELAAELEDFDLVEDGEIDDEELEAELGDSEDLEDGEDS